LLPTFLPGICDTFAKVLPKIYQEFLTIFQAFMCEQPREQSKARLRTKIKQYPKLTKSNAQLFPYRNEIRALRARDAAYDDIRLILAQENVVVSLNTLYRFCRDVLGENTVPKPKQPAPKAVAIINPASIPPPGSVVPASFQTALQERRERLPGLWGRRKRGPRIADSKNL
jgi:hypothetical protein